MRFPEFHYRWEWQLRSSPEALWPLVSDTNRFNRDIGVPDIERRSETLANARRRLRLERFGVAVEWDEEPFEWTRPSRFGVVRHYVAGPVGTMRVLVEMTPTAEDGCHLVYQVWAQPRNWLGLIAIPAEIGVLSGEALRPGEECSVGSVAIVFTDLRSSTQLYREIGDAVAFGHVLNHFDVLKESLVAESGAVVKTIGDAMMAVFPRPLSALRAMLQAQEKLARPARDDLPLLLKVGLHYGPCIAVTLNGRLDYFGSTINIAARLEGQSSGRDVIISTSVRTDPEVSTWLADRADAVLIEPMEATLKGFDRERFALWRVRRAADAGEQ